MRCRSVRMRINIAGAEFQPEPVRGGSPIVGLGRVRYVPITRHYRPLATCSSTRTTKRYVHPSDADILEANGESETVGTRPGTLRWGEPLR